MSQIKVIVNGALGRMGQQVVSAVIADPGLQLVGGADIKADRDYLSAPGLTTKVPLQNNLISMIEMYHPDVIVDFTVADAAMNAARLGLKNGSNIVMGTTGLSARDLKEIETLANNYNKGAIVAPNYAIGAVVLMHLVKIAARYFDNAEIIELHHDKKLDAPSGTALATAKLMNEARKKPFVYPKTEKETLKGTRGGQENGLAIHSVRLPGLVAHHEVVFGAAGQSLSIRHDTMSRDAFLPGITAAVKKVVSVRGAVLKSLEEVMD